jgi:3-phenylpropionate/trans-cinnamate dioxygenase ferredoxin reductase component
VDPYVIVGAGLAGAKAAQTLREEGFAGPVVLLGDEEERPYERPPLSKGYLLGKDPRESAYVHPADWYAAHDVDLRLGSRVVALRPADHEVETASGERLRYGKLLLTTGSDVRTLDVPGARPR